MQDMQAVKEATMTSEFQLPEDTQWDESPRNAASRVASGFGWILVVAWVVGVAAYLLWQIANDGESIRLEGLLSFGLLLAFGLIVLSALIDRLQTRKTDPYRKVKK